MYWTINCVMNVRVHDAVENLLHFSAPMLPAYSTIVSSAGLRFILVPDASFISLSSRRVLIDLGRCRFVGVRLTSPVVNAHIPCYQYCCQLSGFLNWFSCILYY